MEILVGVISYKKEAKTITSRDWHTDLPLDHSTSHLPNLGHFFVAEASSILSLFLRLFAYFQTEALPCSGQFLLQH